MGPRVLVVDDSAVMRGQLRGALGSAGYRVSTAQDGETALDRIVSDAPDLVTLDINMPRMSGLDVLDALRQTPSPPPVILISSLTEEGAEITLRGLALGAFDFVCKPGTSLSHGMSDLAAELLPKISAALAAPRRRSRCRASPAPATAPLMPPPRAGRDFPVVLIGASTGGPGALETVLAGLGPRFAGAVVVAQHMPAAFTRVLAQRLDARVPIPVREADRRMPLAAGTCYIARGGADCILTGPAGQITVQPVVTGTGSLWHPSIDRLVRSALAVTGPPRLSGVLLTGMGDDGAAAFTELKAAGGSVIAEAEESCVVFGMSKRLIRSGGASEVLSAGKIGAAVVRGAACGPRLAAS